MFQRKARGYIVRCESKPIDVTAFMLSGSFAWLGSFADRTFSLAALIALASDRQHLNTKPMLNVNTF